MKKLISTFRIERAAATSKRAMELATRARESRRRADKIIDNIYAELNGCGDRWFLTPHKTIKECNDDN